ncbi:Outer membrane lipoprotein carrier protein LolA [hydrothermal vent metagenome]|uniref:Outer membrane lipoprotein carrier protein LolA n=1 Tax=hydrothermal vent metagenome TaxID=652676 RepID=A0A1W1BDY5_9ZZZZ
MKSILITLLLFIKLQAQILQNLTSFEANFTQTIDDKEKKVVKYEGKIFADKNLQKAKWSYYKPIRKDVYIQKKLVTIVEPELEQVIIRKISNDFDIFELLKNAKKIGKDLYLTKYKKYSFKLYSNGKDIQKLVYKDDFDNLVTIKFKHQKYNQKIDPVLFTPDAPKDYDLIIE